MLRISDFLLMLAAGFGLYFGIVYIINPIMGL